MSAAPPSERIAFHPAIEMPRKRNWTSSQRTSGAWVICRSSSSVDRRPRKRGTGREALEDVGFDTGVIDADQSRGRDGRAARRVKLRAERERAGAVNAISASAKAAI